jgi:hypothetical protein
MNTRSRWIVHASALVLVLTNAGVLIGVAYNRTGIPESRLDLTERELGLQRNWMWQNGENSGLTLRLQFRTEPLRSQPSANPADEPWLSSGGGAVPWLDRSKLATLGFDVSTPVMSNNSDSHYRRMLGRDVLLVLELEGPAHQHMLQAAREAVTRLEAVAAAGPDDSRVRENLRFARSALQREEQTSSRLFVVDAGLDRDALEREYRNRAGYAIVRGQVVPVLVGQGSDAHLYGMLTAVRCDNINVPLQFRHAIPAPQQRTFPASLLGLPAFHAVVVFGRRLEPWIIAAHAG